VYLLKLHDNEIVQVKFHGFLTSEMNGRLYSLATLTTRTIVPTDTGLGGGTQIQSGYGEQEKKYCACRGSNSIVLFVT
jgi:hypothetical protein